MAAESKAEVGQSVGPVRVRPLHPGSPLTQKCSIGTKPDWTTVESSLVSYHNS